MSLQWISTIVQTNGIKHKWLSGEVIHLHGNEKYNYFNWCCRVINHAGHATCPPRVQRCAGSSGSELGWQCSYWCVSTQRGPTASQKTPPGLPDPGTVFEAGLKSLQCLIRSYVEQKWAERGFTDRVLVGSRLMGVLMGKHSIPACWNSNKGIYGPSLIYSWWLKSFFPQTCISTHSRHLLGVHYMPTSILLLNLNTN